MNLSTLPNGDEVLFKPEVARVLRCSVKTVDRLITDGKLKSGKNRGRVIVLKSSLVAYVNLITAAM